MSRPFSLAGRLKNGLRWGSSAKNSHNSLVSSVAGTCAALPRVNVWPSDCSLKQAKVRRLAPELSSVSASIAALGGSCLRSGLPRLKTVAHGHTLDPTSFLVDGHSDTNLIATCAGRTLANEILWIGCTSTRCVAQSGGGRQCQRRGRAAQSLALFGRLQPEPTVLFVAVTNEEPQFCFTQHMGSAVNAAAARARGDRIALMVSREMLGYDDYRAGSQHYPPLFRSLATNIPALYPTFRPHSGRLAA